MPFSAVHLAACRVWEMRNCCKSGIAGRGAFSQRKPPGPDRPMIGLVARTLGRRETLPKSSNMHDPAATGPKRQLAVVRSGRALSSGPRPTTGCQLGPWRGTPVTACRCGGVSSCPKQPVIAMLTLGVKIYAVIPIMRVCIYSRTLWGLIL